MNPRSYSLRRRRGSALVTTMMLAMALMIIIASVLGYSLSERRLNYREAMRLEARNAAEAMAEYGMAQVHDLMQHRYDMTPTRFTSGEGSLVSPVSTGFFNGSLVAQSGANAPELVIGTVVPVTQSNTTSLYYYSPTDPDNASDPLKGCYAFRFDVKVISKATVVPPTGGAGAPQTCYMNETLSARASPLFSRAIFYNMDLEIAPGPTMNILGATHTNGNLYVKKQSSSGLGLNFVGPVTVAKNLYATVKQYLTNVNGTTDDLSGYTDNVYFSTAAGGLTGIYGPPTTGATSIWRDQKWGTATENATTDASFRSWASQTYSGNLQTILHGVLPQVPPGISTYIEDPTPADGIDQSVNAAHQMIEPAMTNVAPNADSLFISTDVESQKYATQCGIYIVVNPTSTTRNGHLPDGTLISVPARKYRAFAHNTAANSIYEIVLPGQPDYGANNATINVASNPNSPISAGWDPKNTIITVRVNEITDLRRSTYNYRTISGNAAKSPPRSATNPYTPKQITLIDVDMTALKMAIDKSLNGLTTSSVYYTTVPPDGTATNSALWTGFIYNNTTGTGASALPPATALTAANQITNLAGGAWNGAIYIESIDAHQPAVFPLQPIPASTDQYAPLAAPPTTTLTANSLYRNGPPTLIYPAGGTAPTNEPSGVRLINGRGHVATYSGSDVTIPKGLTIATNDACYVLGHWNADGVIDATTTVGNTTNSGRFPDDSSEQPCSICCDSITLLSTPYYTNNGTTITQRNGWNDALSGLRFTNSTTTWSASWATSAASNSNTNDGNSYAPIGYGYLTAPTVAITGGGGSGAAATATISNGQITGFTITNQGTGYTSTPTVTITGGSGTCPSSAQLPLSFTLASQKITGITISGAVAYRSPYNMTSGYMGSPVNYKFEAADVEISAAFMAGIVISNKDNNLQNSGSANNYPRFVEEWANDPQSLGLGQRTVAIRGSIVAMYESRAATEPWNWRVMNAPVRLWGFNNLFATGHFPPLTPIVMDYRRVDFNDITQSQYNSYKSSWGL
jgi:hypothetical protein